MKEYIVSFDYDKKLGITTSRQHEEITRCIDCKYSRHSGIECAYFATLENIDGDVATVPADVEPDGFCAWGERKVDA